MTNININTNTSREKRIAIFSKAIADELKAIVDSNVIEWDEWLEDGESYFPVYLQMVDGMFNLHYGNNQMFTDHTGQWSNDNYLTQDMDDENYLELAIALFADLFNNY